MRTPNTTIPRAGDGLLTTRQVAARLQISTRTVRRLAAMGTLPAVRIGRLVRFHQHDVRLLERPL
ncbi:helix-turn-helix domain-containing protein [Belnapia rosea]|uniref:helix-turn-helix domain-containing protein n=1 Tax=Belnapia rosea TaxID=938405 RepID=UPI000B887B15